MAWMVPLQFILPFPLSPKAIVCSLPFLSNVKYFLSKKWLQIIAKLFGFDLQSWRRTQRWTEHSVTTMFQWLAPNCREKRIWDSQSQIRVFVRLIDRVRTQNLPPIVATVLNSEPTIIQCLNCRFGDKSNLSENSF